ncbi:MAG: hypothetical protein IIB60_04055 [Planctomycetes bacterium]|nr:hypothetical protein [Planctomycetota bacterium]
MKMSCCLAILLVAGCGTQAGGNLPTQADVLASVINVTPFTISVTLSGILDEVVDTVGETIAPSDTADVLFVCIDELVVGDPLEPGAAGVTIHVDGDVEEIAPFTIIAQGSFRCGDVIEIIVSGADPETFVVNVFALTPP